MTPTLLLILDGWGLAAPTPGNAPYLAPTPNLDNLNARCPHAQLAASGRAVGLPEGYMGNSEVGHLNIGAGRVVYQDMTRIDVALEDGSFAANPVLGDLLETVKKSGGRLHLAGLLSDGGVHSHIRHLEAICDMAARAGVPVRVHCIMAAATRTPKAAWALRARWRSISRTSLWRALPVWWGVSTPWTATSAGTGSRPPGICWSTGRARRAAWPRTR